MATITTFTGKKFNRVPRHPRVIINIFLDAGLFKIYCADFQTPDGVIQGLSVDQDTWIEAVKEDGKYLIGSIMPKDLNKRDKRFVVGLGYLL